MTLPAKNNILSAVKKTAKISLNDWFELNGITPPDKLTKAHIAVILGNVFINYMENNNACIRVREGQFWAYNGYFFEKLDAKAVTDLLMLFVERAIGLLNTDSGFIGMMTAEIGNRAIPLQDRDTTPLRINFLNGTLEVSPDMATYTMVPHSPSHNLTYVLPYNYEPKNNKKPLFDAYLSKVLPDTDLQKIIAEYIGYVLAGNNPKYKHEKALVLHGHGSNGKSVMFEIITALVGQDNVTNYSLRSLTDLNGYARAQISGKLLNYCSETGTKHNSDLLKTLISGEPIEARLPYKDPFIVKNYAKFIFNTNELPQVEHTDAFFRRLLIIPFGVTITEAEKDVSLAQKIIASELPAIMNWAISGLIRFAQNGFSASKTAKSAVSKYKQENDSVLFFVKERYTVSKQAMHDAEDLYSKYKGFCITFNFVCVSYKTFLNRLKNAKILRTKNRKKYAKLTEKI